MKGQRKRDWMVSEKSSRGGEEGVSRLTGSPSVLGLPPPSVYRSPAETEGTTELHTPPRPDVPTLTDTQKPAQLPLN